MDRNTALTLWAVIWFIFIGVLCFLFQSTIPLWLLILWILGFLDEED